VRRHQPPSNLELPSIDDLREQLAAAGVTHVGVCDASVLSSARRALHERKALGFDGGMGFTYRNPDRSTDPRRAVEGARSVIAAARPYLPDAIDDPDGPVDPPGIGRRGRVGKYAWVDHYAPLLGALRAVAERLRAAGHRAVAFADDNSLVDRAVAHRAGLGWYGKNANLLLPGAGSFFVLGSVVTTAVYDPVDHPVADGCGSCRRCIDACPTGAIVADGVVDGGRCISWVGQRAGDLPEPLRAPFGDHLYGCDDCQDVCPISVRLGRRNTIELDDSAVADVDLLELLAASDDELLARHGRWYIADRDPRWLRRNALVILGNVGDPDDDEVRAALQRYGAGSDPILAEHARWALDRLRDRSSRSLRA